MRLTTELQHLDAMLVESALESMRPRVRRSMREFAEQEIILPNGPRRNLPFSIGFAPWTGLMLREYSNPQWRGRFLQGPAQAGKTLLGFCLPVLYHLFELQEDVICLLPNMEIATGIWQEKLLPVLDKTRYSNMKPAIGTGSRGGKFTFVRFGNGSVLRFMAAGGGDEQRSSHTARVTVYTEGDKMDSPGAASEEASPIHQLMSRSFSFGDMATMYGECTPSTKDGAIYQAVNIRGTGTQIWIPCPHCGRYLLPDREHLTGHQDAESVLEARDKAAYACNECGALWSDDDRIVALDSPRLVHKGQKIDESGALIGNAPKTDIFGLCYSGFHFPATTLASMAEREFHARISESENDEIHLCQHVYALPYEPDGVRSDLLSAGYIRGKTNNFTQGLVPADADYITTQIDVGKRACHWAVFAWRKDCTGFVIDYGVIEVPESEQGPETALLGALRDFREDTLDVGWKDTAGQTRLPDLVGIDSRYCTDTIFLWCMESDPVRYKPFMGFGSGNGLHAYRHPGKPTQERIAGDNWFFSYQADRGAWLLCANVDFWKRHFHQRLLTPSENPGSVTLYMPTTKLGHLAVAKHFVAEIEEEDFSQATGRVVKWVRKSRNNHWLDAAMLGCVLANVAGARLHGQTEEDPGPPSRRRRKPKEAWIDQPKGWISGEK